MINILYRVNLKENKMKIKIIKKENVNNNFFRNLENGTVFSFEEEYNHNRKEDICLCCSNGYVNLSLGIISTDEESRELFRECIRVVKHKLIEFTIEKD